MHLLGAVHPECRRPAARDIPNVRRPPPALRPHRPLSDRLRPPSPGRHHPPHQPTPGRVSPAGLPLASTPLRPGEAFSRLLNRAEFAVSEMPLSSYPVLRSEGDTRFIAIPVFPSRIFRHSALYVRADSPIEIPEDLKGKRVGVGDYQMTAAVWGRGLLTHEYGVKPEDVVWVTGKPIRSSNPPDGN